MEFKFGKELIKALYAIRNAINGEGNNNSNDENNELNKYIYPDKNIMIYRHLSDDILILYYFVYNTVEEHINFMMDDPDIDICCTFSLYNNNNLDIFKCFYQIDWYGYYLTPPIDNPEFKYVRDIIFDNAYISSGYDSEITEESYYNYEGLINEIEGYYVITTF